jgi:hypothetical protein
MRQQDSITVKAPYKRFHKLIFGDDPDEQFETDPSITGSSQSQVEPIRSNVSKYNTFNDSVPIPETGLVAPSNPGVNTGEAPESDFDTLKGLLRNPPSKDEYQPSKTRRVAGGIIGGLTGAAYGPEVGAKVSSGIVDKPYTEAYQDWATRTGALDKSNTLDLNRQEYDIKGQQAEAGSLNAYSNYLNRVNASDPTVQGNITRAKTKAEEEVKEPGREKQYNREQGGRKELANITDERVRDIADLNESGRNTRSQAQIDAADRRVRAQLNSREGIAKAQNQVRKDIANAATKNQRVPPNQQLYARAVAEGDVSRLVQDEDELTNLFTETVDNNGNVIGYRLKPESQVPENYKKTYKKYKMEVDDRIKKILGNSFNPSGSNPDEDEDDYEIEGIEP